MPTNEYVMFNIHFNCHCEMNGTFFVQYNGNEDAIKKFKKINTNGSVKFYPDKFSEKDVMALTEFKDMWDTKISAVTQRLVLKGKFTVPGGNREYDRNELCQWWDKYFNAVYEPDWENNVEEVIDLLKAPSRTPKKNDGDEYVMIKIHENLDGRMDGIYFVQYTGNESAIKKFKKINEGCGYTKVYDKKYTYDQVIKLNKFKNIWEQDNRCYDNIQRYIFSGKFNVPGENREHNKDDLVDWWIKYLGDREEPNWSKLVEEIIDLQNMDSR